MPSPPEPADVVVLGGGITGAASAYQLAKRGTKALLEKGEIVRERSEQNWGFIRQQGRAAAERPLMVAANRLWRTVPAESGVDIEWVPGGNLSPVEDAAAAAAHEARAKIGTEFVPGTRVVAMREIQVLVVTEPRSGARVSCQDSLGSA